jgi:hypothetical protein
MLTCYTQSCSGCQQIVDHSLTSLSHHTVWQEDSLGVRPGSLALCGTGSSEHQRADRPSSEHWIYQSPTNLGPLLARQDRAQENLAVFKGQSSGIGRNALRGSGQVVEAIAAAQL